MNCIKDNGNTDGTLGLVITKSQEVIKAAELSDQVITGCYNSLARSKNSPRRTHETTLRCSCLEL